MTTQLEVVSEIQKLKSDIRSMRIDNIKECKKRYTVIDTGYVRCLRTMDKIADHYMDEIMEIYGSK